MSDFVTTPVLGLFKPTYDADDDQWGNHLNENFDILDGVITSAAADARYLPLTGGELSGNIIITNDNAVGSDPGVSAGLTLSANTGGSNYIQGASPGLGLPWWEVSLGSSWSEGGEGGGSPADFQIARFNDAGALIDYPLTISRATGVVTFGPIPPSTMRRFGEAPAVTATAGVGTLQGHAVNGTMIQGSGATHDIQFLNQAGTSVLALDAGTSNWGPFHVTATGALTSRSVQDRASEVYNVLDYGAVPDAQVALTTATIAAGTTTLTVGASIFAATDVGKAIGVGKQNGVGVAPFNPWINYVTITGYTAPNIVTVSAPPSTGAGANFGAFNADPSVIVWGTENSVAFQAASNKIRDGGRGCLHVPLGRYLLGNTVYLYLNTTLRGDGVASEVVNAGIVGTTGSGAYGPLFANYNGFNWPGGTSKKGTTGWLPTTLANMTDHDITVRDMTFNYGASVKGGNSKGCLFILARKIKVLHCKTTCPGNPGNMISCIGCWDVEETGNITEQTNIAFDHWGGIQKLRILSNTVAAAPNAIQAINVNAQGNTQDDANNTCDVVIDGNIIELNGAPGFGVCAFDLDTLGSGGSLTQTIHVTHNTIRAISGSNNIGIVWRGSGGRGTVSNNVFDGLDSHPVLIGEEVSGTVALTTPWTIASVGATTATIAYPGHVVGAAAPSVDGGPWLHVPAQTVGGIVFSGTPYSSLALLITQVIDANTLQVRLPSPALSAVTSGGMSGNYFISRGCPNGITVADNTFIDPKSAPYMISIQGNAHHVGTNKVVFRDPANPTIAHATIVRVETWGGSGTSVVRHQTGPDGTGPVAGYAGTGNVAWATANGGNQPVMVDDPAAATTAPIGDESTTVATTAFAARAAGGVLTVAVGAADMTLTTAQVEARMVVFSGSPGATRTITMPVAQGFRVWLLRNTCNQNLVITGGAGSSVTMSVNSTAEVWTDGTNIFGTHTLFAATNQFRLGDVTRNQVTVTAGATTTAVSQIGVGGTGGLQFTSNLAFNSATPIAKPTVSGAKASNAALASLLAALVSYGLIADTTTA